MSRGDHSKVCDGAVEFCVCGDDYFPLELPGSTGKLWSRERLTCFSSLYPLQTTQRCKRLTCWLSQGLKTSFIYKTKMVSLCLGEVGDGRKPKQPQGSSWAEDPSLEANRQCKVISASHGSSRWLEVFPDEYHWQKLLSLNIFFSTRMIPKLSHNYWWSWQWCP